jgi:hypothetical protein
VFDRAIVVAGFVLGGWDVFDFAAEASVVEPFDVGEGLVVDVVDRSSRVWRRRWWSERSIGAEPVASA